MIGRQNISDKIRSAIGELIFDGSLPADSRINEVHLAEKLDVSRTPLREALHALTAENIVTCVPRRGFFVAPLTEQEFCDIYAIRPIIDPAALALAGLPSQARIAKLESLDKKLVKAANANAAVDLDDAWHLELLADCPNRVLMDMVQNMIRRTRRYELAYLRDQHNIKNAVSEHTAIIDALRDGSMRSACAALRRNLTSGNEPILEWLRNTNPLEVSE
jgi:DNA-binding GntR family transcriptional regulator